MMTRYKKRINELVEQLKQFHNTKEYKDYKINPTKENYYKAKKIREQIVK